MRYVAVLILGFILGAGLTNLLMAYQQEQLYLNKLELEQHLTAAREELSRLKESQEARENDPVIVTIEPVIFFRDSKPSSVESRAAAQVISQKAQEVLAPLKGQKVSRLNPALIPAMIDGRTVKVENRNYELKVILLMVSDRVIVHIEAHSLPLAAPVPGA